MSDDIKMNELKIENHGVIPKEEEHTTPEELYERLVEKIKKYHFSLDTFPTWVVLITK